MDVFDPINTSGRASLSWTPLPLARTAVGAQTVARLLSSVVHIRESDESLRHVVVLLWIAGCQGKRLQDLAYWAAENPKQQLERAEPFLRATAAGDDPTDAVHAERVRTELRALPDLLRRDADEVLLGLVDESANLTLDQLLWFTRQDVQLVTVWKALSEIGDRSRRGATFLAAQRVVLRLPGPFVGYGDNHLAAAALGKTDLASYDPENDRRPSHHRRAAWPSTERSLLISNGRAALLDPV